MKKIITAALAAIFLLSMGTIGYSASAVSNLKKISVTTKTIDSALIRLKGENVIWQTDITRDDGEISWGREPVSGSEFKLRNVRLVRDSGTEYIVGEDVGTFVCYSERKDVQRIYVFMKDSVDVFIYKGKKPDMSDFKEATAWITPTGSNIGLAISEIRYHKDKNYWEGSLNGEEEILTFPSDKFDVWTNKGTVYPSKDGISIVNANGFHYD